MLDNFKIDAKQGGEGFEPLPVDVYQVELFDITSELKPNKFNDGAMERILNFQFTVVDEGEYRGRNLWRNFVPSMLYISQKNGKNVLYQIIEAFIGRELKEAEIATMDSSTINKLIGFQCRVSVKNKDHNGKTYSNIESFLPKKTTLKSLTPAEKEKAIVKPKEKTLIEKAEEEFTQQNQGDNMTQTPNLSGDDIPTINLDEEDGINMEPQF